MLAPLNGFANLSLRILPAMNKIDPKRAVVFVGVFSSLAIFISSVANRQREQWTPQQPVERPFVERSVQQPIAQPPAAQQSVQQPLVEERRAQQLERENQAMAQREALERQRRQREQEIAAQRAAQEAAERTRRAEEAAAAHARYLARYLNSNVDRKPGAKTVALVVVSESGKFNRVLSAAVADRLKADSVQILPSFFKPEFVSDGLLNAAFTDPAQIFKKLELANSLDAVLFARQKVEYSTSPGLENLITATMELELAVFPTTASADSQTWSFRAPGPGFKQSDARAAAEERIIKQIAKDTKMSLTALFTNN